MRQIKDLKTEYSQRMAEFNELNDYSQDLNSPGLISLQILFFVKIVCSDLFFLIFGIVFYCLLFCFIRKQSAKQEVPTLKLNLKFSLKSIKKHKTVGSRLSSMIILNGMNFMALRVPQ